MSIYCTIGEYRFPVSVPPAQAKAIGIVDPQERPAKTYAGHPLRYVGKTQETWIRVWVQAVPDHIQDTGPEWDEWLPPPVPEESGLWRAVFFVVEGTDKATERNGQEYVDPLLVLTGKQFKAAKWVDLMVRLEDALALRYAAAPERSAAP
jgi:hypothetical protein